ncbi:MAG: ABC transporter permease [Desulfopila sp.]|jgi:ABC-2 type transport system permease protein|nr:ABC transporter permease [Desulfopila sp.]
MMTGLKALIIKELLSYLRDPKSRMTLIIPPLMQLLIFSYAATLDINNVDLVVLNHDNGTYSREVIERVSAGGFISHIETVSTEAELKQAIDERRALAALRFQADFSRRLLAGTPAEMQVILDGRRANSAQVAQNYFSAIVADINREIHPVIESQPQLEIRNWYNPNLIYQWFIVPALVGTLAMASSLIICALSIAREREMGTFEQLLVAPTTPLAVIIGKMIPALIVGSSLGCVMIAAGVLLFRIPFTGSLPLLLLGLVVFIISVVGIGLMISSICSTQQQAILGTFSVIVPLILLSGFATPVENMPELLQAVSEANPLKHFLVIVQGSFLKSLSPKEVFLAIRPMFLIFFVTFTLAVVFVRKNLQ